MVLSGVCGEEEYEAEIGLAGILSVPGYSGCSVARAVEDCLCLVSS